MLALAVLQAVTAAAMSSDMNHVAIMCNGFGWDPILFPLPMMQRDLISPLTIVCVIFSPIRFAAASRVCLVSLALGSVGILLKATVRPGALAEPFSLNFYSLEIVCSDISPIDVRSRLLDVTNALIQQLAFPLQDMCSLNILCFQRKRSVPSLPKAVRSQASISKDTNSCETYVESLGFQKSKFFPLISLFT